MPRNEPEPGRIYTIKQFADAVGHNPSTIPGYVRNGRVLPIDPNTKPESATFSQHVFARRSESV